MADFLAISEDEFLNIKCKFALVPFPLEATVSYGSGTKNGPYALFNASQEVELFDTEYDKEIIYEYGFTVYPFPDIPDNTEEALNILEGNIHEAISRGYIPVTLGGEHTITSAVVQAVKKYHDDLIIVQFDAHLDLRNAYQNNKYSHACAMRRCLDDPSISLVSIGIRNISFEESNYLKTTDRVKILDFRNLRASFLPTLAELIRNRNVYITFDADALDPSIMPSTGTPEPDGLLWADALSILQTVASASNVVGFDYVEHAPIPNLHAPDFLGAKLIYKVMSYIHQSPPLKSEYFSLR